MLKNFDMRPVAIAKELGPTSPVYYATAKNGHSRASSSIQATWCCMVRFHISFLDDCAEPADSVT